MSAVIEAEGLTKRYGAFTAVDRVNLRIEEGQVCGFLGPNGAGKTTTVLMLLGMTEPTEGTARVAGHSPLREPLKVKTVAGYLPENLGFYGDLTGQENLLYTASLNGIRRAEALKRARDVLQQVGLSDAINKPVKHFSRGMRQRLGIADVLIKQPKVVFLDEPTQGIDPVGVEQLLKIIKEMPQQGITVMLTSHQLHQMQRICDRVGIMSGGRLVAEGTIESLSRELGRGSEVTVELEVDVPDEELRKALLAAPGVQSVEVTGNTYRIRCSREARPQLSQRVMQGGKALISMHTTDDALQEIYLRYFQGGG